MIFIETKGQFLMKVTKSAVGTAFVWCIFCNCFSTDIYKDVISVDAQKFEAKEGKGPTISRHYLLYPVSQIHHSRM